MKVAKISQTFSLNMLYSITKIEIPFELFIQVWGILAINETNLLLYCEEIKITWKYGIIYRNLNLGHRIAVISWHQDVAVLITIGILLW